MVKFPTNLTWVLVGNHVEDCKKIQAAFTGTLKKKHKAEDSSKRLFFRPYKRHIKTRELAMLVKSSIGRGNILHQRKTTNMLRLYVLV